MSFEPSRRGWKALIRLQMIWSLTWSTQEEEGVC